MAVNPGDRRAWEEGDRKEVLLTATSVVLRSDQLVHAFVLLCSHVHGGLNVRLSV